MYMICKIEFPSPRALGPAQHEAIASVLPPRMDLESDTALEDDDEEAFLRDLQPTNVGGGGSSAYDEDDDDDDDEGMGGQRVQCAQS